MHVRYFQPDLEDFRNSYLPRCAGTGCLQRRADPLPVHEAMFDFLVKMTTNNEIVQEC